MNLINLIIINITYIHLNIFIFYLNMIIIITLI